MELIEFQHCIDQETANETVCILKEKGIPCRISSGRPAFDVSSLGGLSEAANEKIIISIAPDDYPKARATMETDALTVELPDDYHLNSATHGELQEIVRDTDDWSPFDVAHAKRLLAELGIEVEDPEILAAKRLAQLKEGKKAPPSFLVLSILLLVLGMVSTHLRQLKRAIQVSSRDSRP